MRLRALALGAALVLTASAAYAAPGSATAAPDPCGDGAKPSHDLARVDLHYSAGSFQVRVEWCDAPEPFTPGDVMAVDVHLESLGARVHGHTNDAGREQEWGGFTFCKDTTCVPIQSTQWTGTTATAYGGWADVLPGVPIPDSIEWYATLTPVVAGAPDRVPDAGTATSNVMPVARASYVTLNPIPTARYWHGGNHFDAAGDIRYDSATGPRLDRNVTMRLLDGSRVPFQAPQSRCVPETGACSGWRSHFFLTRNTTVVASFDGDGFVAPSNRPARKVLISAFVSLDLPATKTVRRGTLVIFRGVVRPKAVGTNVTIQVRNGGAGAPWRTYATVPLWETSADTYYYSYWRPTVTGKATFRTVWLAGTTADGGVINGISNYTTITVI